MWRPGTEAPGAAGGEVQQCPLRSSWSTMLDKSGVWGYSVPGGKQGGPAQPTPVRPPQQQKQQDLRQLMKSSASALDGVAAKAQLQVQTGHPNLKPKPKPKPNPRLRPQRVLHLRSSPQREGRGGSGRGGLLADVRGRRREQQQQQQQQQ